MRGGRAENNRFVLELKTYIKDDVGDKKMKEMESSHVKQKVKIAHIFKGTK